MDSTQRTAQSEQYCIPSIPATGSRTADTDSLPDRIRAEQQQQQTQSALEESQRLLHLALESGSLGTWQVEIASGRVIEISDTCRMHLGMPLDREIRPREFFEYLHPDDVAPVQQVVQAAVAKKGAYALEYRVIRPNGAVRWISAHGVATAAEPSGLVRLTGVTQDITDRKLHEAKQADALQAAVLLADHDQLTGLLNHRAFHKQLEERCAAIQPTEGAIALVMIDLDNFKFFNDAYGHTVGDEVIRQVASRLQSIGRPGDVPARFGGDEFSVLVTDPGNSSTADIERRIESGMDGLIFRPPGHAMAIPITVSVGAAIFPGETTIWRDLVQHASERLEWSKSGGASRAEAYRVRNSVQQAVQGFSMLDALVTAVHNKDRYTRRHSEDVMSYSLIIARQLGIDGATQHTIAVAALLHDVGKVGVPDAILRKPASLTSAEFEAVKQHPPMGAVIVSAVPGLEGTLDAIQHHHERWDGRGYPFGLHAEETPLIARLMAVADAFSAMTTDRPYRLGMDRERAIEILAQGSGSQWDPECVEAFLAAVAGSPS